MLDLTHTVEGQRAHVEVHGELDIYTAPRLSDLLSGFVDAEVVDIELDLADVEFMDSSGLSAILGARKEMDARGGSLTVLQTSPFVARLLDLTGLAGHFSPT